MSSKIHKDLKEVTIDGTVYVPKATINQQELNKEDFVIVRTHSAGVFAGYLHSREGQETVLLNARRIWYWDGAASLSQLSVDGTSKPENCKFPVAVQKITLPQAIEVIPCTQKAKDSIEGVPTWKA